MSKARGTIFFFCCACYSTLHYMMKASSRLAGEVGGKRGSVITAAQLYIERVEAIKGVSASANASRAP